MTQEQIKQVILDVLNVDFTTIPADELKENFAQKISKAIDDADTDKYNAMKQYVDEKYDELKKYVDEQIASISSFGNLGGSGGIGTLPIGRIPTLD